MTPNKTPSNDLLHDQSLASSRMGDDKSNKVRSHEELSNSESVKRAERTLIARLIKTQRAIRRVDLLTAFGAFATLALGILFLGILCDSWLLPSGLSVKGRVFFIFFLLVVSFLCFLWKLVPVLKRRVNSLYAAKILEETQQDKHNLTINWLQLCRDGSLSKKRASRDPSNDLSEQAELTRQAVLENVVLQAARQSKSMPEETSVDCTSLIRWGIAFACLVTVGAVYVVLSPKSPFVSAARIVAPLSDVERPQALRFESVEPGDAQVFQSDFLKIEASIPGAKNSETVEILWSTEDGRITDVAIPMESSGPSRFTGTIPDGEEGFSENLSYKVVAGRGSRFESVSDAYHVVVRPQPSFRVEKTTLQFPDYTGLAPQTFNDQGDVRAIENTTVEVVARANEKLARAYLLPDGDQTRAVKMTIDAQSPDVATASFTLNWKDANSQELQPEFTSYTLLSEDVNGEKNRDALVYEVSILPDLPPTIDWSIEDVGSAQVPLNGVLPVRFVAEDPDYSLRRVLLHVAYGAVNQGDQADQKPDPEPIELQFSSSTQRIADDGPTPFAGPQTLSYNLIPQNLGLSVGDELEYWGVAFDSKTPDANVGTSEKRVFVVIPSGANGNVPSEQEPENDQQENSDVSQSSGSSEGGADSSDQQTGKNDNSEDQSGNDETSGQQGENSADQQESAGQEGEESDSSSSDASGESGMETGDSSSNAGDSQDQESGGSGEETGASSEQSEGGEQNAGSDSQANQEGSESDGSNSTSGESSESSDNKGDGLDDSGTNDSSKTNSGEGEKEGDEGSSAGAQSSNGDDESGDAFQKILDYMNEQKSAQEGESPEAGDADGEESDQKGQSSGKGSKEEREPSDSANDPRESDEEVDPDFDPSDAPLDPQEKRPLPTRTSAEKPDENSPAYQADSPDRLDPNMSRRKGDVDPDSDDYLGQNADPDAQETLDANKKKNANITVDPLDQTEGTAADSIDRDAPEAKGGKNPPKGGASEIDPDAPADPSRAQSQDQDQDQGQNSQSPTTSGGSSGDVDDRSNLGDSQENNESGGGSGSNRQDDSKKKGATPSNGKGESNGAAHGGGAAGSGLGELAQGEETLAPADAPKLQYAEEATNLVLDYLEDSLKANVDKRLLNELGWSEEEARAFLEKWKAMRAQALRGNAKARDQYLEALEEVELNDYASLAPSDDVEASREREFDHNRLLPGSHEASRIKTPDRLSERVRAFTRGVSTDSKKQ